MSLSISGAVPPPRHSDRIALALSGVGFRAVHFLTGCLRRLNELGLLSRVDVIGSVSGGSLVSGLLASRWHLANPDPLGVFPTSWLDGDTVIQRLSSRPPIPLMTGWDHFRPRFWSKRRRGDLNESDHFAHWLDRQFLGDMTLAQVPARPRFIWSAANPRTGERWHLERDRVGDAHVGYTSVHHLRLSEAVTASAALPGEMSAHIQRFDPRSFDDALARSPDHEARRRVHLLDGSLDDPLALEPCWRAVGTVIVCDAGVPLHPAPNHADWPQFRIWRSLQMALHRSWEYRLGWWQAMLDANHRQGAYIGLNCYHGQYQAAGSRGYPLEVVRQIGRIRCDYGPLAPDVALALVNHGYTVADAALRRSTPFAGSVAPLSIPHPRIVEREQVLDLLTSAESISRAA